MLSDGYELVERDGAPDGADFCLTVTDDCMEPYIRRGERVYVQASAAPGEFEAGSSCSPDGCTAASGVRITPARCISLPRIPPGRTRTSPCRRRRFPSLPVLAA